MSEAVALEPASWEGGGEFGESLWVTEEEGGVAERLAAGAEEGSGEGGDVSGALCLGVALAPEAFAELGERVVV